MRNYKKRGNRTAYSDDQLLAAVSRVKNGEFMKAVSTETGIPIRTIRRCKNKASAKEPFIRTVFNKKQELELLSYITECSDRFYGLTRTEARKLAADYSKANSINVPSSWISNGTAGADWLEGFQKRNRLSLRSPEATSMARAHGFNATAVDHFFTNLTTLMKTVKFAAGRIFNLDETGITNVSACSKVLAPTGRKQIGQITAAERGTLVTVVGCISNDGNAIPPVLLFPRQRIPPSSLGYGSPPGSLILNSPSGWMTTDIFANDVLPHLASHTKSSPTNPILLLVDNHVSHVSLEAVRFCREKGIHLLTFPPHCSHRLQPLDITVYGPFKAAYKRAMYDYQIANPGKRIDIYQLAPIFCRAFNNSFTRKNILKGFEASGISPLNRDIFDETDFVPASVNVPLVDSTNVSHSTAIEGPATTKQFDNDIGEPSAVELHDHQATTSNVFESYENTTGTGTSNSPSHHTPVSVRPLPQLVVSNRKVGRKRGHSKILTSSPQKKSLEEEHSKRLAKISKISKFPVTTKKFSYIQPSVPEAEIATESENQFLSEKLKTLQDDIQYDAFYAVQYDKRYYIGRVDRTKCNVNKRSVNFLVRDRDVFKWPIRRDIDQVHTSRFFFGPIVLEGHDPFVIDLKPIDLEFRLIRTHFPDGL